MNEVERKTDAVNLRISPKMKTLLRIVASREHRTISNMIETLVINYCKDNGISVNETQAFSAEEYKPNC